MIRAGTGRTVYAFSRTVQSEGEGNIYFQHWYDFGAL